MCMRQSAGLTVVSPEMLGSWLEMPADVYGAGLAAQESKYLLNASSSI